MKIKYVAVLGTAVLVCGVIGLWPQSDETSAKLVIGEWQAVDPANGALHGRKEGPELETAKFATDGSLSYRILPASLPAATQPAEPVETAWGWKIQKGRLLVKDAAPESTGEWMQAMKISVSRSQLLLYRKGYPTKEFTRIQ